ncbi:hypothetical protein PC9H_005892 [Pleurotus ostreatus]|uniref:Uncharacterized protein n=1 Tax=Pleurotus ostreatus TaxID=5322 RepID=A0A8H6ZWM1_PLEOS|nr:uncharacterized protein PC9H_005892 [Pleurotus ostreatus]KAF7430192.1 hypothetical protein PC9H_005892 [Pleurotus ostreatus]
MGEFVRWRDHSITCRVVVLCATIGRSALALSTTTTIFSMPGNFESLAVEIQDLILENLAGDQASLYHCLFLTRTTRRIAERILYRHVTLTATRQCLMSFANFVEASAASSAPLNKYVKRLTIVCPYDMHTTRKACWHLRRVLRQLPRLEHFELVDDEGCDREPDWLDRINFLREITIPLRRFSWGRLIRLDSRDRVSQFLNKMPSIEYLELTKMEPSSKLKLADDSLPRLKFLSSSSTLATELVLTRNIEYLDTFGLNIDAIQEEIPRANHALRALSLHDIRTFPQYIDCLPNLRCLHLHSADRDILEPGFITALNAQKIKHIRAWFTCEDEESVVLELFEAVPSLRVVEKEVLDEAVDINVKTFERWEREGNRSVGKRSYTQGEEWHSGWEMEERVDV